MMMKTKKKRKKKKLVPLDTKTAHGKKIYFFISFFFWWWWPLKIRSNEETDFSVVNFQKINKIKEIKKTNKQTERKTNWANLEIDEHAQKKKNLFDRNHRLKQTGTFVLFFLLLLEI